MIEILRAGDEIISVTKEGLAPTPIPRLLPIVCGFPALWMKQLPGGNVRHQPCLPISLDVVLDRSWQKVAVEIPDQQIILNAPAFPKSGRRSQNLANQPLVLSAVTGLHRFRPIGDTVTSHLV